MSIYMKIEGIMGSATGKYGGWIELESCQMGANKSITTSSDGAPSVHEVVVTKFNNSDSAYLFKESLWGTGKKVTIDFVKDAGAPYLSLELDNTLISNYSIGRAEGGSNRPLESLSLDFANIKYSVKPTAVSKDPKDVKDRAMWDLVAH